ARALLRGDDGEKRQALPLLVSAAQAPSSDPTAEEAMRLLAQQEGPEADTALQQLPSRWQDSAPVLAHRSLASGGQGAIELLKRWPGDPASWDLQWELARKWMLAGRWADVQTMLSAIDPAQLPPALAARQRFWLGYSQRQLGQDEAATATWRELRLHHPGGYYGWRAAVQLGEGDLSLKPGGSLPSAAWTPLSSGDSALDRLWRLDQRTEAWEAWRHQRGNQPPRDSRELLL
ncbi:MAG: tetratricopeptide repeat protein, partial [Cyanobacteriota bacterium]